MKQFHTSTIKAVAACIALMALCACQKPAGPAERAGQAIDQSAADMGKQLEKAGEKIQDAAKGR